MVIRRAVHWSFILFALTLLLSCATKKYVKQEVGSTHAELSKKLDEEAARRADLGNQMQELTSLNKQNTARIEEVNRNLGSAVKALDPKIEDAKKTGSEARATADVALGASKENAAAILNRNNYQTVASRDVLFKFGSASLDDAARAAIDEVAKALAGDRNLLLELEGYADSTGDRTYNLQLSGKRVESVLRYLVGTRKADLHRVYTLGLGQENPVADNSTAAGRAQNRRVTMRLLGVK